MGDQILRDMPPHVQIFEEAKLGKFYGIHELLGHPAGISLALVALYVTLKRKLTRQGCEACAWSVPCFACKIPL